MQIKHFLKSNRSCASGLHQRVSQSDRFILYNSKSPKTIRMSAMFRVLFIQDSHKMHPDYLKYLNSVLTQKCLPKSHKSQVLAAKYLDRSERKTQSLPYHKSVIIRPSLTTYM